MGNVYDTVQDLREGVQNKVLFDWRFSHVISLVCACVYTIFKEVLYYECDLQLMAKTCCTTVQEIADVCAQIRHFFTDSTLTCISNVQLQTQSLFHELQAYQPKQLLTLLYQHKSKMYDKVIHASFKREKCVCIGSDFSLHNTISPMEYRYYMNDAGRDVFLRLRYAVIHQKVRASHEELRKFLQDMQYWDEAID
jgi:hypothetical protein